MKSNPSTDGGNNNRILTVDVWDQRLRLSARPWGSQDHQGVCGPVWTPRFLPFWLLVGEWLGAKTRGCTPEGYMHFLYVASRVLHMEIVWSQLHILHAKVQALGALGACGCEWYHYCTDSIVQQENNRFQFTMLNIKMKKCKQHFFKFSVSKILLNCNILKREKAKPIPLKLHLCNYHNIKINTFQ